MSIEFFKYVSMITEQKEIDISEESKKASVKRFLTTKREVESESDILMPDLIPVLQLYSVSMLAKQVGSACQRFGTCRSTGICATTIYHGAEFQVTQVT